jgi:hypothetical protein
MPTKPKNDNRALMAHVRKQVIAQDRGNLKLQPLHRFVAAYACALLAMHRATSNDGTVTAQSCVAFATRAIEPGLKKHLYMCRALRVALSVLRIQATKTDLALWLQMATRQHVAASSFEAAQDVLFTPRQR